MPTMCALDKDGKLLYLKTAPKLGGGDIGREKWNQNAFRDEQLFPIDVDMTDEEVASYVFFEVPTNTKDRRGWISFSLCDTQGKNVRASFKFEDCNSKKTQVGMCMNRIGKDKWIVRAIGESVKETGYEEAAKLMNELTKPPKMMSVTIVEARGLRAFDSNGKSDPYIKMKSNRQVFQTEIQKKTLEPKWNATTEIAYFYDEHWENKDILFEMFDHDKLSKDDIMGIVLLDNSEIFAACESG